MFQIKNNNVRPQQGNILISEPFLCDQYFERSVVLLVEHNHTHGTIGLVLNKPIKEKLNDFFPELKSLDPIPLFRGGPVSSNKLYFIHTLGDVIPGTIPIRNGLYFDGDFDFIKSCLLNGNSLNGKFKFFLGYSGWDQNQLHQEIEHNSWLVSNLDDSCIFKEEGEICWKKSLQALGAKYRSWANFPKRPQMN